MKSHICSSSNKLWRIIENGFKATALHMIQIAVGAKDWPHIAHFTTAKDAWQGLEEVYVGNESMRRTRFEAFRNSTEGFYKLDNEDHEEMYRRLKAMATTFRNLGAKHIDDEWIKSKYVSALMTFEPIDLKSLQGRYNYYEMTSNQVMQEM